jgi:polar amino acid transport system substrate-binding protein
MGARHLRLFVCAFAIAGFAITAANAQTEPPANSEPTVQEAPAVESAAAGSAVRVAIKPLDPFVIEDSPGEYRGFSIDLWKEIANRNEWKTDWVYLETVSDVLNEVETRRAKVGIAGITINREREDAVDFSHSMFNSGLSIAASRSESGGVTAVLKQIFNPRLVRMLAILAAGILIVGNMVWLVRFRRRPAMRRYRTGVIEGIWFAGKTLGSADFGSEEPTKPVGRMLALAWMFAGIIMVQYFTALTTASLTVSKIDGSIQGVNDLPGKRIVTVEKTTADRWLTEQGYPHERVKSIDLAYPMLLSDRVDAIVYDTPVLLRWVATAGRGQARLAGPIFKAEAYGIAVPQGDKIREQINASLLEIQSDGTYDSLYDRWFSTRQG